MREDPEEMGLPVEKNPSLQKSAEEFPALIQ